MSKGTKITVFENRLVAAQKCLRAVRRPKTPFRPLHLNPRIAAGLLSKRLYALAVMAQPVCSE